jgi:hypothetical protein
MANTSGKRRKSNRNSAPRKSSKGGQPPKKPKLGNVSKNIAFWLLIILLPITLFNLLSPQKEAVRKINYSQFIKFVDEGQVKSVTIIEKKVSGKLKYEAASRPLYLSRIRIW